MRTSDALDGLLAAASGASAEARLRDALPALGDLSEAVATAKRDEHVILAQRDGGPLLVVAVPSTGDVHSHGSWGAALVLEGTDVYERWERIDATTARLAELIELNVGESFAWDEPPGDIHRQTGGAVELLLLGVNPRPHRTTYTPANDLTDQIVDAFVRSDGTGLMALYRPDAVADINLPSWRFQLQGIDAIGELMRGEFEVDGRCSRLNATQTSDGVALEFEVRFPKDEEEQMWRDVHLFHTDGTQVVRHVVYCTGHWDAATIARQHVEAPMVRR